MHFAKEKKEEILLRRKDKGTSPLAKKPALVTPKATTRKFGVPWNITWLMATSDEAPTAGKSTRSYPRE